MNEDQIVTVMAVNGSEYVGKLAVETTTYVKLKDPRFVTMTEQGMGFAHGIAMTGVAKPKEVTLYNVLFVTETNPEVAAAYRTAVSGLITKPDPKIVL